MIDVATQALRCLVQQMLDWDITQRPSLDTVIATTCDVLFQDSSIDTRGGISSQGLAKLALQQKVLSSFCSACVVNVQLLSIHFMIGIDN